MIPTIETIVEDVVSGTITKSQAVTWLHQHAEDAGYWLRDEFASHALAAIIAVDGPAYVMREAATHARAAYVNADAMIAERSRA